jgi:hypothetical protein
MRNFYWVVTRHLTEEVFQYYTGNHWSTKFDLAYKSSSYKSLTETVKWWKAYQSGFGTSCKIELFTIVGFAVRKATIEEEENKLLCEEHNTSLRNNGNIFVE